MWLASISKYVELYAATQAYQVTQAQVTSHVQVCLSCCPLAAQEVMVCTVPFPTQCPPIPALGFVDLLFCFTVVSRCVCVYMCISLL